MKNNLKENMISVEIVNRFTVYLRCIYKKENIIDTYIILKTGE